MAKKLLGNNKSNRNISNRTVAKYAAMMARGEWGLCPTPIVKNGQSLLDGQHRLAAVIKYGKPVKFVVCSGADDGVRQIIDQGRVRSVSDVLKMEHGIKNASSAAACAKWIRRLDNGNYESLTHFEAVDIIDKNDAAFRWMNEAITQGGRYFRGAFLIGPLMWAFRKWPEEVDSFYTEVATGEMLSKNSPSMRLRTSVLTSDTAGAANTHILAFRTLTAFRAYMDGADVRTLRPGVHAYLWMRTQMKLSKKGGKWAAEYMARIAKKKDHR